MFKSIINLIVIIIIVKLWLSVGLATFFHTDSKVYSDRYNSPKNLPPFSTIPPVITHSIKLKVPVKVCQLNPDGTVQECHSTIQEIQTETESSSPPNSISIPVSPKPDVSP